MKFFSSSQKQFALLGIVPNQPSFNDKLRKTCFYYVLSVASTFIFLLFNVNSFWEYINSVLFFTGCILIATSFTVMTMQMAKFFDIIDRMEKIVEEQLKNPESKALFFRTNKLMNICSEIIFFAIVVVTPYVFILPKLFESLFKYFMTGFDNDALEMPLPIWLPFSSENPICCLIDVTILFEILRHNFITPSCLLSFGIEIFLVTISMADDMTLKLNSFHKNAITTKNCLTSYKQLTNFFRNHSTFRQIFYGFSDLLQPIFIVVVTWSLVTICGVMLMFQFELSNLKSNLAMLVMTICFGLYSFGVLLVICESSQRTCNCFIEINDTIDQFPWYLYSRKIQQTLPMAFVIVQQPIVLRCFGSITCDRETFKKIVNKAFSYFMVLRKFG